MTAARSTIQLVIPDLTAVYPMEDTTNPGLLFMHSPGFMLRSTKMLDLQMPLCCRDKSGPRQSIRKCFEPPASVWIE